MYFSSVSSRLLLYDTTSWELKHSHGKSDGILRDVSWSDDSKYILLVNPKGEVEVLSPAIQNLSLQHIPIENSCSASFQRDGHRHIAVGTLRGEVIIWDAKNKERTKTFPTSSSYSSVNFLSYNAKNTSLAASMQNGDTVIYGLVSNIPVSTVKLTCSKSISAMKFHHESRSLLGLATDEGHLILRDTTTNKDKVIFEDSHASPVTDFVFSLINRDVMLSSGYDKVMKVYDIRQQHVVSTVKTSHALTSLAINIDNQVALGTQKGFILLYDLRDLTSPFKVLKGHEDKVQKVAFQPLRKKYLSTDLSLVEKLEMNNPVKIGSPVQNCSSDMFFVNTTPQKHDVSGGDNADDSFLAMVFIGDKSIKNADNYPNRSCENIQKSDKMELRFQQLEPEKITSKSSTPIINRTAENIPFKSPMIHVNGVSEDINSHINISNIKSTYGSPNIGIDNKTIDDLKDFMKLNLSYIADENKNYYLHTMMALTKQKLYLEKQLSCMSNQIETLVQNQNTLIEANRKLTLEINQLKSNNYIS